MTAGVVAGRDHPLHGTGPEPRDLAGWPWIDFDGPFRGEDGRNRPSLAAVLDDLRALTGRPVRAVLRAGSAGLTLLAAGPWLAWLPLDLLDRLPGSPLRARPLSFGQCSYCTGFVARLHRLRWEHLLVMLAVLWLTPSVDWITAVAF